MLATVSANTTKQTASVIHSQIGAILVISPVKSVVFVSMVLVVVVDGAASTMISLLTISVVAIVMLILLVVLWISANTQRVWSAV